MTALDSQNMEAYRPALNYGTAVYHCGEKKRRNNNNNSSSSSSSSSSGGSGGGGGGGGGGTCMCTCICIANDVDNAHKHAYYVCWPLNNKVPHEQSSDT